jgi:penicillin amidase
VAWLRRTVRIGAGLAAALVLLVAGVLLWVWLELSGSRPRLDGELGVPGLAAPVTVERDELGVPAIRGGSREDVAFATGFLHAQERFFQMDLLRRQPAGELAGLFGARTFEIDAQARVHRFRERARRALAGSTPAVRRVVEAYAAGVNAGLADLGAPPFEYLVLRAEPAAWRPEDSFLVLLAMFVRLQDEAGQHEAAVTLLHGCVPEPLAAFLLPEGTEWDAPLVGEPLPPAPIPGPEVLALSGGEPAAVAAHGRASGDGPDRRAPEALLDPSGWVAGSNAWAVAAEHSAGGALLANELHLGLGVPNLWYRALLEWQAGDGGGRRRVVGATLPGTPAVVVGSNGRVAWGLTNSLVDTSDLVTLELDPDDPEVYRTPDGPRRIERHREAIRATGGEEREVEVPWTVWGPIVDEDPEGRPRALRWVAHESEGVDLSILALESAGTLDEALDVARASGIPALNFVAADAAGRVGWTIAGRLPRRLGFDGRVAGSWAEGARRWDGLLAPAEVPAVADPPEGRIWSANHRMVDGEGLALLGNNGYVLGARAAQIRDALLALEGATPEDMLALQLDDRALFLGRWRELLLRVLGPEAVAGDPRRREARALVEDWGGRAAVGSAGYRIVRTFRGTVAAGLFDALTAGCAETDPEFSYYRQMEGSEGPLWQVVSTRPGHLVPGGAEGWEEWLLARADETLAALTAEGGPLAARTWGERNTTAIRHPLSGALPGAGRFLDMPPRQLPGDDHMPRVQHPSYGATLRMVVSPGREEAGFFHMPGGQSGHPLARHYGDGHGAWERGDPSPLLPGPAVDRLVLRPAAEAPD